VQPGDLLHPRQGDAVGSRDFVAREYAVGFGDLALALQGDGRRIEPVAGPWRRQRTKGNASLQQQSSTAGRWHAKLDRELIQGGASRVALGQT
jgi:hypothetical protein